MLSREEAKAEKELNWILSRFKDLALQDCELSIELLSEIAGTVSEALAIPRRCNQSVRETLIPYIGKTLTADSLEKIARQFALGQDLLRECSSLGLSRFRRGEVSTRVIDIHLGTSPRMELRILDTVIAGQIIPVSYTQRFLQWLSGRNGLRGQDYEKIFHPFEFFNTELSMKLTKEEGKIEQQKTFVAEEQKRRNSVLRLKREKCTCDKMCHFCPIGLDGCPLATHPETYTVRMCGKGHKSYQKGGQCLHCLTQEYRKKFKVSRFGCSVV